MRRKRSAVDHTRLPVLRLHGAFPLAYSATFQAGLEYFGGEDGFLAYKQAGSTALVLANPVTPVGTYEILIQIPEREKRRVLIDDAPCEGRKIKRRGRSDQV